MIFIGHNDIYSNRKVGIWYTVKVNLVNLCLKEKDEAKKKPYSLSEGNLQGEAGLRIKGGPSV